MRRTLNEAPRGAIHAHPARRVRACRFLFTRGLGPPTKRKRKIPPGGRRRAARQRPGGSPETAIVFDRFDVIDDTVYRARCTECGGRYSVSSEGSVRDTGVRARVVHVECVQCESEADFFFKPGELLH